jgi:3-oxoacyl-[acyl-carrier protein] reductase
MARLDGKIALVTGAARGIGEAIARRFHQEGAQVVVNDLDLAAAEKVASDTGGFGVAADVADSASVASMFEQLRDRCGRIDVLVNNAGISGVEANPALVQQMAEAGQKQMLEVLSGGERQTHIDSLVNLTDEEWRRMLAVHLDGSFYCSRAAVRLMIESGSSGGCILNMSSVMGTSGSAAAHAYGAAKAGILGLTRTMARELASRGIRVNAIAPGWIESEMTAPLAPLHPGFRVQTPLGRLGEVDDVAWAAVYLASDEAKFVTGQVLSPNGGWTMNQ